MSKLTNKELETIKRALEKIEDKEVINSESGKFSKKILKRLFIGFIIFVIAILIIFVKTGNEPSTLVGGVIAFLSVEVWQLARIKINETKGEE